MTTFSCTDEGCKGTYTGPEFIRLSDIAHQFSNTMSTVVGDKLKELYKKKKFVKVNFSGIQMSTEGMDHLGDVVYTLSFPFESVSNECEAYTSFDHVGGWDHAPALDLRKRALKKALLPGEELAISPLKSTQEGLQEYWIQWKNKDVQAGCAYKGAIPS
jgi:hypothetical protein